MFLLPSAFSISAIILLFASILSFFYERQRLFHDNVNKFFLASIFLLVISGIFNSNRVIEIQGLESIDGFTKNIGLLNWLPLILCFYSFQTYLKSRSFRRNSAVLLFLGTLPVIYSVVGQAFFGWHGPLQFLNGLIIWYQRPIDGITSVTGLFNNQNYLGSWLTIIWPFGLALFLEKDRSILRKIFIFAFQVLIAFSIILSASRAAWLNLLISIPIFFGTKSLKFFIPLLILILTIFLSIFIPIFGIEFQNLMKQIIPSGIWENFNPSSYEYDGSISRVGLWKGALKMISENPLFGTGSSTFGYLLESKIGIWRAHSHNLPLELMVSYGIPAAISILIPITFLIKKSYEEIFINGYHQIKETLFDRAWITSLILLSISHLVDIQYFDGRISIAGWSLLAGAWAIIRK